MIRALAILAALVAWTSWAAAQDPAGRFAGGPNAGWFSGLRVPGMSASCCDMTDCHRTPSEFRAGQWWALSAVYPGEWVAVPNDRLLDERSIFADAVLCEAKSGNTDFQVKTAAGHAVFVYCFARPPYNG